MAYQFSWLFNALASLKKDNCGILLLIAGVIRASFLSQEYYSESERNSAIGVTTMSQSSIIKYRLINSCDTLTGQDVIEMEYVQKLNSQRVRPRGKMIKVCFFYKYGLCME